MRNFKSFNGGKGPSAGARGGMRISATATAARSATLLQTKHSVSVGRGNASGRSISTAVSHQQQEQWRTDLFGRPILRLPTFSRAGKPVSAVPLTVQGAASADATPEASASSSPRHAPEPAAAQASSAAAAAAASPPASEAGSQPASPQTPAAAEAAAAAGSSSSRSDDFYPETGNNSPLSAERLAQPVLARFLVPDNMAGFLIGNKGERVVSYKERSGAKVWVSGAETSIQGAGMRMVCMSGRLEQVVEAVTLVFTDLTSDEAPAKRKAYFKSKDGKLVKARFLAPAWLSGTILGREARNVRAVTAETGGMLRLCPSAAEDEADRLVEVAGADVGVIVRAVEEVLKLFLRNPKYKAVYIAPGVSGKALAKRKEWYSTTQRMLKEESRNKWIAKTGGVAEEAAPGEAPIAAAL